MSIKVLPHGPYRVSGALPLKRKSYKADSHGGSVGWEKEETLPIQEEYLLCRCGHSKNKPYCDGTHQTIGFEGLEIASKKEFLDLVDEVVDGDGIELLGASQYCAVARFCHPGGGTWQLAEESKDPTCKKMAIRQACTCPSGRLVMRDKATGKMMEDELDQEVTAIYDGPAAKMGPLQVTGGVEVEAANGEKYATRNRMTLCRCGRSQNKPFCDASHMNLPSSED